MAVRSLLITTLDNMAAKDLRRFTLWLSNELPEGVKPIGKGKLENKGVEDIVDLMVETHGEKDVGRVAVLVLRKSDLNNLAAELEKSLGGDAMGRDGAQALPPCPAGKDGGASMATAAAAPQVSIECNSGKVQAPVINQMAVTGPLNMTFN